MVEKEISEKYSCNVCTKALENKEAVCNACEKNFGECESTTKTMESLEEEVFMIMCSSCKMENFIENEICVYCDKTLDASFTPIPDKF